MVVVPYISLTITLYKLTCSLQNVYLEATIGGLLSVLLLIWWVWLLNGKLSVGNPSD